MRPRLLFLVTEDWYFCSHRLPLALAAREQGFDVIVATRVADHGSRIRDAGLELVPLALSRRSQNPLREAAAVREIVRVYRAVRPTIAHHVAMKPVLYGSLAARIARVPGVVNALAGLGYLFSSRDFKARLLRPLAERGYHALLDHPQTRVIVQNPDDLHMLTMRGMVRPERAVLIPGSGVDPAHYRETPEPEGTPLVVLPARMLRDKGVCEFVAAAGILRERGVQARFALVGDPDPENPGSIPASRLRAWAKEGVVEYWGWHDDMEAVFRDCHIVCLPSYREGLPKALIEAAACARPIVTCDTPGCRQIVRQGDNGLLVPVRDSVRLADALAALILDRDLRGRMGRRGRARAVEEFSLERVIAATLDLYRSLMAA